LAAVPICKAFFANYVADMKTNSLMAIVLAALVLAAFASGCASKPKTDWNARVGNYTFDQAVIEFGPPAKQSILSDGRKVADWVTGYTGGSGMSFGVGGFGSHTGVGVSQSVGSGGREKILRLTFGADGRLQEWVRR
jgi:hypothetical protein